MRVNNKEKMFFSEDLIGFTILCLLKQNRRKFQLTMEKQSQIVFTAMMVMIVQGLLVYALFLQILSEVNNFIPADDQTFQLFLAKFLTTIALHLSIYSEYSSGMNIMKFVNNHPHSFDMDKLAFALGAVQFLFAIVYELCNIIVLFSRVTVYFAISSYVALEILFLMQKMYFNKNILGDRLNLLKDVMLDCNAPRITQRSFNTFFKERSMFHKVARINYKFLRGIYVSVVFYFVPFMFLFIEHDFNKQDTNDAEVMDVTNSTIPTG